MEFKDFLQEIELSSFIHYDGIHLDKAKLKALFDKLTKPIQFPDVIWEDEGQHASH